MQYICKYCGKTVVHDYGLGGVGYLPSLIDHLILVHRDKLEEIGAIYLSDIPNECYIKKMEERTVGRRSAKKAKENGEIMYSNIV